MKSVGGFLPPGFQNAYPDDGLPAAPATDHGGVGTEPRLRPAARGVSSTV